MVRTERWNDLSLLFSPGHSRCVLWVEDSLTKTDIGLKNLRSWGWSGNKQRGNYASRTAELGLMQQKVLWKHTGCVSLLSHSKSAELESSMVPSPRLFLPDSDLSFFYLWFSLRTWWKLLTKVDVMCGEVKSKWRKNWSLLCCFWHQRLLK